MPRKLPVQARAAETVGAICEAAMQLLEADGLLRLTTIGVAKRAGVSVGTYYQYFPNKEALLITLVSQYLRRITTTVEAACRNSHGRPTGEMSAAFLQAYVEVQLERRDAARVVYRMALDISAGAVLRRERRLVVSAIAEMLRSSPHFSPHDVDLIAWTFFGAVSGATRAALETSAEAGSIVGWEKHLGRLGQAYLESFESPKSQNGKPG